MPRELSTTATVQQDPLNGVPIDVAVPPGSVYPGVIFRDRSTGAVYLNVTDGPGGPSTNQLWELLNASSVTSGTPVLYLVDDRYPVAPTPNGPYPTVAQAKAALLGAGYGPGPGGPATIMILRGVYPENVNLDPSIRLSSMGQSAGCAVIAGNVVLDDPAGATLNGSITGITIAPPAGDALLVAGTAMKTLRLTNCELVGPTPTDACLRLTNTAGALVVGINSNLLNGSGFQGGAGAAGQLVWFSGGLNGQSFSVQNRDVGLILDGVICGGAGPIELGAGFATLNDLLCFQTWIRVVAGNDHLLTNVVAAGSATVSPLTVDAGARATLTGSFIANCTPPNRVVVDGAGIVESTASLQFRNGDTIAPTVQWNVGQDIGRAQPRAQLFFDTDPPSNPYDVPARFETLCVRPGLSAPWVFRAPAANTVVEGAEFVFKNLDPLRAHDLSVVSGTIDNGMLPLPVNISPRNFMRLRAARAFNDWMQC